MAFYAQRFIYNGVPSHAYGLFFGELDGGGESTSSAGSQISIMQQNVFRKPVPFFYGTQHEEVLEFDVTVLSETEITANEYAQIGNWLFGQANYGVLRIMQKDMKDAYYNCFFTEPETIRIGNIIKGFTATVVCDAPWAWREPKTYAWTPPVPSPDNIPTKEDYILEIYNQSANDYYTYPTSIIVRADSSGGTISFANWDDDNRRSVLTGIYPNEVIRMNSDLQIITADPRGSRVRPISIINSFNLKWLRLVPGTNRIRIRGGVKRLTVTYPVAYKAG